MNVKQIGLKIKKLREEKNVSAKDIYTQIGMDASLYSKFEGGKRGTTIENIRQICILLNLSADDLLELRDKKSTINDDDHETKTIMEKLSVLSASLTAMKGLQSEIEDSLRAIEKYKIDQSRKLLEKNRGGNKGIAPRVGQRIDTGEGEGS